MKRVLSLVLTVCLAAGLGVPVGAEFMDETEEFTTEDFQAAAVVSENAEGEDIISAFDDYNFRQAVYSALGQWGEPITAEDCAGVTELNLKGEEIRSLAGLEYFVNLIELDCSMNQIQSISLSNLTSLQKLDCGYNFLVSLDISKNVALRELNCSVNPLAALDVSKNTALVDLNCSFNDFTSLDVSKNTALTVLICSNGWFHKNWGGYFYSRRTPPLKSLDISKNGALEILSVIDNELKKLDVSKNPGLVILNCTGNKLKKLNVTNKPNLRSLCCQKNRFRSKWAIRGLSALQLEEFYFEPQNTLKYWLKGKTFFQQLLMVFLYYICFGWIWLEYQV